MDLGKNQQWMLKPLGSGDRIFTQSQHTNPEITHSWESGKGQIWINRGIWWTPHRLNLTIKVSSTSNETNWDRVATNITH